MYQLPPKRLLYDPRHEHDACGVGFIAHSRGEKSHDIVRLAVQAVINLTHRGAVGGDAKTGDGAGITAQLPYKLFNQYLRDQDIPPPSEADLAAGVFFLPREPEENRRARDLVEASCSRFRLSFLAWRPVPIDQSAIAGTAAETQPDIQQALLARSATLPPEEFPRALYLARRVMERDAGAAGLSRFYVPSFSHRTIVYKGMLVAPQLPRFYLDLTDPSFETALALFHQRYSTNTFPSWELAQPFRALAHNGEINTLQGNINWMRAREADLSGGGWETDLDLLKPVTTPGSDSGMLDNVLDLLVASGRDIRHAIMMLVPEAWEQMAGMDERLRAFYEYHACLMEPWDGPAAISFTDGVIVGATLDRNGLRPARYTIMDDGLVVMASEAGVLPLDTAHVVEKGRLGPGQMIAIDTLRGVVQKNDEIKQHFASRRPYGQWLRERLVPLQPAGGHHVTGGEPDIRVQKTFGFTFEDMQLILKPMALEKKEPVGSMGNDTPIPLLSPKPHLLSTSFKQKFAQVTNPPIDPLREELVMSSRTYLGPRRSLLDETEQHAQLIRLDSPLLFDDDLAALRALGNVDGSGPSSRPAGPAVSPATVTALWPVAGGEAGMVTALRGLCAQARQAVEAGAGLVIISDRGVDADHAPIPMLLAVGAVHHALIRAGLRMRTSIIAETGAAWDVHHFAVLLGYGAAAINPYLAHQLVLHLTDIEEEAAGLDLARALQYYRSYAVKGILKVMSKMGVSTLSSYQGGQMFEAVGVGHQVINECFTGTVSSLGGTGYEGIAAAVLTRHRGAFARQSLPPSSALVGEGKNPAGDTAATQKIEDFGYYRFRKEGDPHAYNPFMVRALHKAVASNAREDFKAYAELARAHAYSFRDLLQFKQGTPIPIEQVEPVADIMRRFTTGAMSLGSLSPEAHRIVARAMNSIGGKSDTGEGGEEPWRFRPVNGVSYNSAIKQVASGRFGVTPDYLAHAHELEIKIAQGSKPGEGGQLPGHKVVAHIAAIRHTQPGVSLISPPPHHDIYSIEDLAQLIYDMKMVNPRARVGVKLVSEAGVGTIAAGVAKGYADSIHIAGYEGGTGASPLSSIKNAGTPWELGLAETQQVLVMNNLRHRVTLRTDGGFRTGRDVVIAAMLGADEFGFGTAVLIAIGCQMARQCHLNTCPVGIATQRDDLRTRFQGTPDEVIRFLAYVAGDVRETLATLGFRSLDEITGRSDLLEPGLSDPRAEGLPGLSSDHALDFTPLLTPADPTWTRPRKRGGARNDRGDTPLDDRILKDAAAALDGRAYLRLSYPITNAVRTAGGRVAGEIARRYTDRGLPEDSGLEITFTGTAGQSFGAFAIDGLSLRLVGEANDYAGKGMHGGEIIIQPPPDAPFAAHENVIAGNTVLYGATGGRFYAAGRAGERFCVRNSGAVAVVEGTGDHACEYMTGGVAVILGETGRNFAAGMSGGVAFVLDESGRFPQSYNQELVSLERVTSREEQEGLRCLIERHGEKTGSARAGAILAAWDRYLPLFYKVVPHPSEATGRVAAAITAGGEPVETRLEVPVPAGVY